MAGVFGRLVVHWLYSNPQVAADIDLVVANPTHSGRTPIRHIEEILAAARAADAGGRLPIPARAVLVKTVSTAVSKDQGAAGKERAAWEHAQAVRGSGRYEVRDKRILLIDDVCTTGLQLNYVAARLRAFGAADVQGLVLGRVTWDTP